MRRDYRQIGVVTETGYQGVQKIHAKTQMPKKRSKKNPLTKEDKKNNQQLFRERVLNENVIGSLKRFKILTELFNTALSEYELMVPALGIQVVGSVGSDYN